MKTNEIREMSSKEITTKIVELKKELLNLRFQLATGGLENTAQIKKLKRDVARLNTVLTQMKNEAK